MTFPIILASESIARKELLQQIEIIPDLIIPADIDETPKKNELPRILAGRLAKEKALKIANSAEEGLIIAADSVVGVGRRILPKALTTQDVEYCLKLLSGKRHRVYTGICVIRKDQEKIKILNKICVSIIKFKCLNIKDIAYYTRSNQGIGKAGGYSIQGYAASFISFISGSYSNIVGLPIYEIMNLLTTAGYKKY